MKIKIVKSYIYEGLGFPIKLKDVEMVMIDGELHPKVDVRKLADQVIKELPFQKERLTGGQVKFIRTYFEMSLREFATKVVNESHTAVAKWEKMNEDITNMDLNIEYMLRLYVHEKVSVKSKKEEQLFFEDYKTLREMNFSDKAPAPLLLKAV
jgi:DNA-binding transcriptional regulator YiaG